MTNNEKLSEYKNLMEYNDKIRNIEKMLDYAFIILDIEPDNTVCIEKIIYWCSYLKTFDIIMRLIDKLYTYENSMNIIKTIFYRENKSSIRNLIVSSYIDIIKKKEVLLDHYKHIPQFDIYKYNPSDISLYMTKIVTFLNEMTINNLITDYIKEKNILFILSSYKDETKDETKNETDLNSFAFTGTS